MQYQSKASSQALSVVYSRDKGYASSRRFPMKSKYVTDVILFIASVKTSG